MHEKLVIIEKKKTTLNKVLNMVWFVLACLMFLAATIITPIVFAIPAVAFTLIWFFCAFRSYTEYEYTYFDGDLRIARIRNKAKRKRLAAISMDDVLIIAPKGDRSVYKYENDKSTAFKNYSSGDTAAKVYELICKGDNAITRYEFEPDEDMLDAMLVKYPRIITK